MSYRSFYKTGNPIGQSKNTLKAELQNLQQELRELQDRSIPRRRYNNSDFGSIIDNKVILIGGCILLGVAIAYFLFNVSPNRCR